MDAGAAVLLALAQKMLRQKKKKSYHGLYDYVQIKWQRKEPTGEGHTLLFANPPPQNFVPLFIQKCDILAQRAAVTGNAHQIHFCTDFGCCKRMLVICLLLQQFQ